METPNQNDKLNIKSITRRMTGETPVFWKKLRTLMLTIGGVSGAILMAPVAIPAVIITVAGYGLAIGSVGTVLSQMTEKQ